MGATGGRRLSQLRRLAQDYEAGLLDRDSYRSRRRELIDSLTGARGENPPGDSLQAVDAPFGPPDSDPYERAEPGWQARGEDLTLALSRSELASAAEARRDEPRAAPTPNTGAGSAKPAPGQLRPLAQALLLALALVAGAALLAALITLLR